MVLPDHTIDLPLCRKLGLLTIKVLVQLLLSRRKKRASGLRQTAKLNVLRGRGSSQN